MSKRRRNGKVGIALAGGGPLGGIYEIGALMALGEALRGICLTDLDLFVGVSAGAFIAAGLANGITPHEMHDMFILDRSNHDPFEPALLLRPAFGEFLQPADDGALADPERAFRLRRRAGAGFLRIVCAPHPRTAERPLRQQAGRQLSRGPFQQARPDQRLPQSAGTSSSSSRPISTPARRRRSARPASITCRSRRR